MRISALSCCVFTLAVATMTTAADKSEEHPIYGQTMQSLKGKPVDLAKYRGKVLLIVNTASECGATPQYEPLQGLHEKYADKGLAVLGFPCNQFGAQEPGDEAEIRETGLDDTGKVRWNFEKFLVGKDGRVIKRFRTGVQPDSPDVIAAIEAALK